MEKRTLFTRMEMEMETLLWKPRIKFIVMQSPTIVIDIY